MASEKCQRAYGSWAGEYEGPEGVIAKAEAAFAAGKKNKSALASDYCAYAARLKADASVCADEAKQGELLRHSRAYLAKAAGLSDEYAAEKGKNLTADECDVRQSILRAERRLVEASEVIDDGLKKNRSKGALHTEALLLIGKTEIALDSGVAGGGVLSLVERIAKLAPEIAVENPLQAIRVYRGLVRFYKRVGDTNGREAAAVEARRLIQATGAEDQEEKLAFDLRG